MMLANVTCFSGNKNYGKHSKEALPKVEMKCSVAFGSLYFEDMLSFNSSLSSCFGRITRPGSGRNTKKQVPHHSMPCRKNIVIGPLRLTQGKLMGCEVYVSTADIAGVLGARGLLRTPKTKNKCFTSGWFGSLLKKCNHLGRVFICWKHPVGQILKPFIYPISKRDNGKCFF